MKSIISLFLLLFALSPMSAEAQDGHRGYCQNAETTADLVDCIGTHYKAEVEKMKDLYNLLIEKDDDAFKTALKENQKDWIAYRDTICDLEGRVYEGGSLQRVQQLDCMAKVTANRNQHLNNLFAESEDTAPPVYASPPRWKNVILNDFPETYWSFGSAMTVDTDCDGEEEQTVHGLRYNSENGEMKSVLAIADNLLTGRPKVTVVTMNWDPSCVGEKFSLLSSSDAETCVKTNSSENSICNNSGLTFDPALETYIFNDQTINRIEKDTNEDN